MKKIIIQLLFKTNDLPCYEGLLTWSRTPIFSRNFSLLVGTPSCRLRPSSLVSKLGSRSLGLSFPAEFCLVLQIHQTGCFGIIITYFSMSIPAVPYCIPLSLVYRKQSPTFLSYWVAPMPNLSQYSYFLLRTSTIPCVER